MKKQEGIGQAIQKERDREQQQFPQVTNAGYSLHRRTETRGKFHEEKQEKSISKREQDGNGGVTLNPIATSRMVRGP